MPRGRPKKAKKVKKKAKRKPGRPKGSKNKKTAKKRGRPKKATKKVAKKRGRPPGKKTAKKKTKKKTKRATGKPMTKMQLASHMAELHEMKKSEARDFISNLVELAAEEVKKNGSFSIPGLGKFVKKRRKARWGRNPATGERIRIKAKTVVKARVSKTFKDEVL